MSYTSVLAFKVCMTLYFFTHSTIITCKGVLLENFLVLLPHLAGVLTREVVHLEADALH